MTLRMWSLILTVNLFTGSSSEYCNNQHNKRTFKDTGLVEIPVIPDDTEVVCLRSNGITTLETDGFSNLHSCVELDLGKNRISLIESGAFNGLNILKTLLLDENALTELRSDMFVRLDFLENLNIGHISILAVQQSTFIGLRNLKQLWLTKNSLTAITSGMFNRLYQLEELGIAQNDIISIDINSFADLQNLNILNLEGNNLRQLPIGVFNGLTSLTKLYLWQNDLTTIDSRVFDVFDEGLELSLGLNPLVCDERLCWLRERIQDRRIELRKGYNKPTCGEDGTEWSLMPWNCDGNLGDSTTPSVTSRNTLAMYEQLQTATTSATSATVATTATTGAVVTTTTTTSMITTTMKPELSNHSPSNVTLQWVILLVGCTLAGIILTIAVFICVLCVRRKSTGNVRGSSSREAEERSGYANPSYLGDSKSNSYAEIDPDDSTTTARSEYNFYDVKFKDYDFPSEMNPEVPMEDNKRDSGVYDSFPVPYKIYNEEDSSVQTDSGDKDSWRQAECTVYEDVEDTKM